MGVVMSFEQVIYVDDAAGQRERGHELEEITSAKIMRKLNLTNVRDPTMKGANPQSSSLGRRLVYLDQPGGHSSRL